MAGRVIQGFFIGGAMRPQPAPPAAGGEAPRAARVAPGPPPLAHQGSGHVAQRHGGNGSFALDPDRLGLARSGGQKLPQGVLAKMEAAFGADFSAVRVHVGPQAARIGAVAFTTGNDLYFAPGRYQPESIQGQQLIGHELAHVLQQRQGRVRAPASGIAVVQDRALEAEADRLGMRAAAHRPPIQAKSLGAAPPPGVRISAPEHSGPGRFRLRADVAGRTVGSVMVHVNGGSAFVSDLGVDASQRSRGIGKMLIGAAAAAGRRLGKCAVSLTADDNGSGRLTRWYGELGFQRTGMDSHGRPRFEAPAARLAGAMQAKMASPFPGSPARLAGPALQRMMATGTSGGASGGTGGLGSGPPPATGTLSTYLGTWRMRLWTEFGTATFSVDEFCASVGRFGSVTSRSGQLAILRGLRAAGALFPPIVEDVRPGLVLSFDSTQAQQAPVRVAPTITNRQAFGMTNPPHDHVNMVPLWAAHAHTPPPQGRDERQHYMSPSRNYYISDNDGNPVIDPATGQQRLEQGHSNLVMGHNPSASTFINNSGHMNSPGTNRLHNYSPSAYGQIESARASAASGSQEPRYQSPSPTRGSWPGYYLSDHPRFRPEYRQRWGSHIRRTCQGCGNSNDHESANVCTSCGTAY